MQNSVAAMENSMVVSQKVKMKIPYDPAIPSLSIYQELGAGS